MMRWHAFPLSRGRDPEYWSLPPDVIGLHQLLLWACAAANDFRGNGGIWRGAVTWSDRHWVFYTGLERPQIDRVIEHGQARWVAREAADQLLADLTPTTELLEQLRREDKDLDWESCRISGAAVDDAVRRSVGSTQPAHVDPSDRHTARQNDPSDRHTARERSLSDRSTCLVVLDYDLGGQVKAELLSEKNRRNARLGAAKRRQLELGASSRSDGSTQPPGVDPTDRHTADPDRSDGSTHRSPAVAQHRDRDRDPDLSPNPLSRGGSPAIAGASAADLAQLEAFWKSLLPLRPSILNGQLWGGAKSKSFAILLRRSKGDPTAWPAPLEPIALHELLSRILGDLQRKFEDTKWVLDTSAAGVGFRSYVMADQWKQPLPDFVPRLELVRTEQQQADEAAEQRRAAEEEAEQRRVWAEEMPGDAFPGLEEAKRRLREKHWGQR